jgi:uncharacterized membrane protein required for colicin V production
MCILAQAFLNKMSFDYFDVFVVLWIILGVFIGRKRGMAQELLPVLQWIFIMILAGLFYNPVAQFLHQNANLELVLASICGYFIIALVVHFIFLWVKNAVGEKLVGSDMFGRMEYYFGMAAGGIQFACMLICLIALVNVRIISAEEMARTEKMQEKNFEGIRFPTMGSMQHAILVDSICGRTVKDNLGPLLIASVVGNSNGTKPKSPGSSSSAVGSVSSATQKKDAELNDILSGKK